MENSFVDFNYEAFQPAPRMSTSVLEVDPAEVCFRDCRFGQAYSTAVRVTNTLNGAVEFTVKPGAADRYTVVPAGAVRLGPRESTEVTIKLRILKFANKQKATEQGHRDVFHIKVVHGWWRARHCGCYQEERRYLACWLVLAGLS